VSGWEDLKVLNQLGIEERDPSMIPEVGEALDKLKKAYEEMRIGTLLNGKYDRNNAMLTLHAGAGIEINPLNGDIKILSFHPKQTIIEEIKELYSSDTYDVLNYFISDANQFEIMVFLVSKLDNSFKIVQVKLEYNSLSKNLNIIDLWSLKP
jgi:hypothetical protein